MIYAPAQQMNAARRIARSAQRQIRNKMGMEISITLCLTENNFHTPEEMLAVIAMALRMSPECYKIKTRTRDVVELRFIGALLLRTHFPRFTLNQIATLFGGQDHSSILSGLARAHNLIYTGDTQFTKKYEKALTSVNAWLWQDASDYIPMVRA